MSQPMGRFAASQRRVAQDRHGVHGLDLRPQIDGLDRKVEAVDSKLTFMVAGFGLLLTFPTVVDDMGFFERTPTSPSPAVETASPTVFRA